MELEQEQAVLLSSMDVQVRCGMMSELSADYRADFGYFTLELFIYSVRGRQDTFWADLARCWETRTEAGRMSRDARCHGNGKLRESGLVIPVMDFYRLSSSGVA